MAYVAGQIVLWMVAAFALGFVLAWIVGSARAPRRARPRRPADVVRVGPDSPSLFEVRGPLPSPTSEEAIRTKDRALAQLASDLAVAHDANDLQRERITELERLVRTGTADHLALDAALADATDELQTAHQLIEEQRREMARLAGRTAALRARLDQEHAMLGATRDDLAGVSTDHGALGERLEQLRLRLDEHVAQAPAEGAWPDQGEPGDEAYRDGAPRDGGFAAGADPDHDAPWDGE